ncbi:unnamed protein product [Sphagnum jensenii]|uniref:Uncharacterized protein n=1 Tax=Sphagnum jensenii TaxID=128206 RepID=A0ABP1A150_9BRYO
MVSMTVGEEQLQSRNVVTSSISVEDGEWLYANGCCRYYEEEAIHRNFVYAQDVDQSYQPGVWWLLPYAA